MSRCGLYLEKREERSGDSGDDAVRKGMQGMTGLNSDTSTSLHDRRISWINQVQQDANKRMSSSRSKSHS
jgi:hypothetical protein